MAVIETNGRFDTDAVCKLLDEYERGYRQHDQHLAAIAVQSVLLIEDAARLYEENERLRDENTRLNAKMSTRLYGIKAADVKRYHEASVGLCMEECKRILVEQAREGEVDRLVNENAKLRELVCMMLKVAGVAEYATDVEWQTITHYLRELGIEVD
jgi:hypothetical protein